MATNNFQRSKERITINDIEFIESQFSFQFPNDFKEHYLEYNGGKPEKSFFILNDTIYGIQLFLSIKNGNQTIENDVQDLKVDDSILPDKLIPFAIDSSGNYFCFSKKEADFGVIYYWDSENYDDENRAVTYLASSLDEFINSMQNDPED